MCLISESIAIVIGNMFVNHGTWCFPQFSVNLSYHIVGDISHEISPLNTHFLTLWLYALGTESKFPPAKSVSVSPTGANSSRRNPRRLRKCQRKEWQDEWMMVPNDAGIQKMRMMMLGVLKTSQMYRHHGFPRICGENSCNSVASPQTGRLGRPCMVCLHPAVPVPVSRVWGLGQWPSWSWRSTKRRIGLTTAFWPRSLTIMNDHYMKPMVKSKLWLAKNPQFVSVLPSVSPGDAGWSAFHLSTGLRSHPFRQASAGFSHQKLAFHHENTR